ncbi:MAG: hypothetical protein C4K60_07690 [Ideonella sp. MAG2]|nr:MAG: hypothetical protein C4K60_07690 [Ideonella sp. MAG2]
MHPALRHSTIPLDALHPPRADGLSAGVALSVVVHIGLITALTLGVQWRSKTDEGVEAELWANEKARQAHLQRMREQLAGSGGPQSTGTAAKSAGPSAGYAGRIKARIRPNIRLLDPVSGNPEATVEVRVTPDGTIIGRRLLKPSGDKAWDEAVLRAIDKTERLPRDTDGSIPQVFEIKFNPQD